MRNLEAEQSVIGAILLEPARLPGLLDMGLTGEDFIVEASKALFEAAEGMYLAGEALDGVLIAECAGGDDVKRYAADLLDVTPTAAHAKEYAGLVIAASRRRKAVEAAEEAIALAQGKGSTEDVAAALERAQSLLAERHSNDVLTINEVAMRFHEDMIQRKQRGGGLRGISTGYGGIDGLLGGLQTGRMIVMAARPGMGKTAMALNIAESVTTSGKTVLYISLEMGAAELCERLCAARTQITMNKLSRAEVSESEWPVYADEMLKVSNLPLYIADKPSMTLDQINRAARRVKPDLLIIDHLGIVHIPSARNTNRREAVDDLSRSIKALAKSLQIPVLTLVQLNRALMSRSSKVPCLADLRESGAIEQDADAVLFIHRPSYYGDEKNQDNDAHIIVSKNRQGPTGMVSLLWYGATQRFAADWTRDIG